MPLFEHVQQRDDDAVRAAAIAAQVEDDSIIALVVQLVDNLLGKGLHGQFGVFLAAVVLDVQRARIERFCKIEFLFVRSRCRSLAFQTRKLHFGQGSAVDRVHGDFLHLITLLDGQLNAVRVGQYAVMG